MKEAEKLKRLIKEGVTKKYFCQILSISIPTLDKRLKDGKFSKLEKEKINTINL